jgi:hypothetical protein
MTTTHSLQKDALLGENEVMVEQEMAMRAWHEVAKCADKE